MPSDLLSDLLLDLLVMGGITYVNSRGGGHAATKGGKGKGGESPFKINTEEIGRKILNKFDEPRAEMLGYILSLAEDDKRASDALLVRQKARQDCRHKSYPDRDHSRNERYKPGEEDLYIRILAKLYVALNGSGKKNTDERDAELQTRKEVFLWLGRLNDEDFDAALELLHDDVIIQHIRRFSNVMSLGFKRLSGWLTTQGKQHIQKADSSLAGWLRDIDDALDRKGVR